MFWQSRSLSLLAEPTKAEEDARFSHRKTGSTLTSHLMYAISKDITCMVKEISLNLAVSRRVSDEYGISCGMFNAYLHVYWSLHQNKFVTQAAKYLVSETKESMRIT